MSNPYEELRLIVSTLFSGEQRGGEICPFCRGGRTGERTLSVSRLASGACVYICHRAQCGRQGRVEDHSGAGGFALHDGNRENKPKEFQPRYFRGVIEEVPDVITEYYIAKYGFGEKDFRATACGWSPEYNRTVWQVRSPVGAIRGYELRSHRDEDRPKTLHYRHSPDQWVGWVGVSGEPRAQGSIVAVEDMVSAHKVAGAGFTVASVMGSHLSLDIMLDLMRVADDIILCLDRDATDKAIKFTTRYAFIAPGLVCLPIERDLKYETHETIRELLDHVRKS